MQTSRRYAAILGNLGNTRDAILEQHRAGLDELLTAGDPVATSRFLRKIMIKA